MDLTLVAVLANIAISAYTFYKVRKIHLANYQIEQNTTEVCGLFSQIQAYHDLLSLIQPQKPLPPLRGWAASPDFLLIIASHALSRKSKTILECSSGASTLVLARYCQLSEIGHVFSLEHDSKYAEQTRNQLKEHGLDMWATVIDAPLVTYPALNNQHWYSLETLDLLQGNSVEFLVIDGPPSTTAPLARYPAIPLLETKFAENCTIMLDDANRKAETATLQRWLAEYPGFKLSMVEAEKGCARLDRIF